MHLFPAAVLLTVASSVAAHAQTSAYDAAAAARDAVADGQLREYMQQRLSAQVKAKLLEQVLSAAARPRLVPQDSGAFRRLRFSPDGRYALAQTSSAITVLSIEPFAALVRAPAERASPATFTPDSREVVFLSSLPVIDSQHTKIAHGTARLERWSVSDGVRTVFTDLDLQACQTKELSPDGSLVACLESAGTLRLLDVASGTPVLEKKKFAQELTIASAEFTCPEIATVLHLDNPARFPSVKTFKCTYGDPGSALITFSPGGRFLAALPDFAEGEPVFWDLAQKREVRAGGLLKQLRRGQALAFLTPDRVIVRSPAGARSDSVTVPAEVVAFPSGKILSKTALPPGVWTATTHPGFVVVRPLGKPSAWAVEFSTGQAITSKTSSLDIFENLYLAERVDGQIGLYERGKGARASLAVPKD
jgi:hypothetical protein